MNEQGKKALVKVAEWLERGAPHVVIATGVEINHFDMGEPVTPDDAGCGTACCIAGAVCQFEQLGMDVRDSGGGLGWHYDTGADHLASNFLGIGSQEASELFVPWEHFEGDPSEFSDPELAARVVRHFIATGKVDWDIDGEHPALFSDDTGCDCELCC